MWLDLYLLTIDRKYTTGQKFLNRKIFKEISSAH